MQLGTEIVRFPRKKFRRKVKHFPAGALFVKTKGAAREIGQPGCQFIIIV
jgi:hypothetical protein